MKITIKDHEGRVHVRNVVEQYQAPLAPGIVHVVENGAVPFDQWSPALRYYSTLRRTGDIGLGDVFERHFGILGGRLFKRFYKEVTGGDCGCDARREWFNIRYPFTKRPVDEGLLVKV